MVSFPEKSKKRRVNMYALKCIVLTLSFCVASLLLWAQPNLSNIVSAGGLSCYRDVNNPDLIYYPPGELSVVTDRQGKSDFNFLQMRYTGNIVYSDQGDSRFTSFVRFRVKMKRISQNTLEEIQNEVWGEGKKGELRPLPISDIRSTLIFTPIELDKTDTLLASNCTITAEDKDGLSKRGTYWKEREFSLRLDNNSTQSLWDAFDKGNTLMSLSYSFFSRGINATNNDKTDYALSVASVAAIVAAVFAKTVDGVTFEETMNQVLAGISGNMTLAGNTLTIYERDGVTPAYTMTLAAAGRTRS